MARTPIVRPRFASRFAILAAATALGLLGCGDDGGSGDHTDDDVAADTGTDTDADDNDGGGGTDIGDQDTDPGTDADAGIDTTPDADAGTDTPPDIGDDVQTDAGDAGDAGGDTDATVSPCAPVDTPCVDDGACGAGTVCIGSQCVAPTPVDDYAFSDTIAPVTGIRLPGPGEPCCFDYTGDGEPDNLLASLIASLPDASAGIQNLLDEGIASGRLLYLVEFRDLPDDACGEVDLAWHYADADLDDDGIPDATLEERQAGDGTYQVQPQSFDERGPIAQFNGATLDGTSLSTRPTSMPFSIAFENGTVLEVPLEDVRLTASVTFDGGAKDAASGEATLSGYVRVSAIFDELNRQASTCACAGLGATDVLVDYGVEMGRLFGTCQLDVEASSDCSYDANGDICPNLPTLCSVVRLVGALADVTTGATLDGDGNPIPDALSFGLYLELSAGELASVEVAPSFQAVGDHFTSDFRFQFAEDAPPTTLRVLGNDAYDPEASPIITSVTTPDPFGDVAIGTGVNAGRTVVFVTEPDVFGITTFDYTIQDRVGNTSTAQVVVRINPVNDPPTLTNDVATVVIDASPQRIDVLANDSSLPDGGEVLTVVSATGASQGAVAPSADGLAVEYTPTATDPTTDSFEYTVSDGLSTATATVAVELRAPAPACGDGRLDDGEDCDDGPLNSDTTPDACRTDCRAAGCGDGVLDTGEGCDDGAGNSDILPDACRSTCAVAGCGDGVVDTGEACDDDSPFCAACALADCADGEPARTVYADADHDGYGNPSTGAIGCPDDTSEPHYVIVTGDCDDSRGDTYPDAPELCGVPGDEDCDAAPDCEDSRCTYNTVCDEIDCYDGIDNDGDTLIDCAEASCRSFLFTCYEVTCDDGIDDDFDGLTDCDDIDCELNDACGESDCYDGIDNDGNGRADCADPYCRSFADCSFESVCDDGIDDDEDGDVDCDDLDCVWFEACLEICNNGIDDNGDGYVDCDDHVCAELGDCYEFECGDGIDNNDNGAADCEDPTCAFSDACYEFECGDGIDNDGDGVADCDDPDCAGGELCP